MARRSKVWLVFDADGKVVGARSLEKYAREMCPPNGYIRYAYGARERAQAAAIALCPPSRRKDLHTQN